MKHGDSGFYFRAEPNDSGVGVHGFQAELDTKGEAAEFKTAGLYETGGRAWVVNPDQEVVANLWKENDWNEMVVTVKGGTAHCTCNGEVLNAAMKVPASGPIGLEGDRGQMEYRRIRLKELE